MNVASFERVMCAGALALASLAVVRWRAALVPPPTVDITPPILHRRGAKVVLDEDSIMAAADDVVSGDPFRVANVPTDVAYSPDNEGGKASLAAAPAPVRAPRPRLVLRAIVGGPPWHAIVDGLPGQPPGTIVSAGMVVSNLEVRSVSRDTVLVQGSDTTWKLTLGHGQP